METSQLGRWLLTLGLISRRMTPSPPWLASLTNEPVVRLCQVQRCLRPPRLLAPKPSNELLRAVKPLLAQDHIGLELGLTGLEGRAGGGTMLRGSGMRSDMR